MLLKQVKIMEDHGPWNFTEEQIIKIKQFDSESINKFYFDNLEFVKRIIGKYFYTHPYDKFITFDDCLQQFCVDIPFYDYSSRRKLYQCIIFGTIKNSNSNGILNRNTKSCFCLSLDNKLFEGQNDLGLPFEHNFFEEEDYKLFLEKGKEIINFLKNSIRNPNDLNLMFCSLFTDLKEKDIKGNEFREFEKWFT